MSDVFKNVKFKLKDGEKIIEMSELEKDVPREEAEDAHDPEELQKRWEKANEIFDRVKLPNYEIDLAPGDYAIRVFGGGAMNIIEYKDGGNSIALPRRDFGPIPEKGKLDIGSGMMADKPGITWRELCATEAAEEGVITDFSRGEILLPDYRDERMNRVVEKYVKKEVKSAMKDSSSPFHNMKGVESFEDIKFNYHESELVVPGDSITVVYETENGYEEFETGIVPEPESSSLEAFLYSIRRDVTDDYVFQDTESFKDTHFDRETVEIELDRNKKVKIHQSGRLRDTYYPREFIEIMEKEYREADNTPEEMDRYGTVKVEAALLHKNRRGNKTFEEADLNFLYK